MLTIANWSKIQVKESILRATWEPQDTSTWETDKPQYHQAPLPSLNLKKEEKNGLRRFEKNYQKALTYMNCLKPTCLRESYNNWN